MKYKLFQILLFLTMFVSYASAADLDHPQGHHEKALVRHWVNRFAVETTEDQTFKTEMIKMIRNSLYLLSTPQALVAIGVSYVTFQSDTKYDDPLGIALMAAGTYSLAVISLPFLVPNRFADRIQNILIRAQDRFFDSHTPPL